MVRCFRRVRLIPLTLFLVFAASDGCKPPADSSTPDSYVENGVLWAYGTVQLVDLGQPGGIMLRRATVDQSVNTQPGQTPASVYTLYGAVKATSLGGVDGGERDVAYVDYHPTADKLLVYSYQLDFVERPVANGMTLVDTYALLKKAGRSYYGRQRVYLGTANFNNGATYAAVGLAQGLKLSLIASGVYAGQWALHYPDAPKVVATPLPGMCPEGVTQMPGQNLSQNLGQYQQCRPLPAQTDLCNGDPTQDNCRPEPPVQQASPSGGGAADAIGPAVTTSDLQPVSGYQNVYVMNADVKEAKIVFTSPTLAAADDVTNASTCADKFYAVARTVNREINAACVVKPAPVSPVGGHLTCAVTVGFDRAQTYLERVCDITAIFRAGPDAAQHVQVLRR